MNQMVGAGYSRQAIPRVQHPTKPIFKVRSLFPNSLVDSYRVGTGMPNLVVSLVRQPNRNLFEYSFDALQTLAPGQLQ